MSEQKISPCLWFDDNMEQAIDFYISVFGGRITERTYYTEAGPKPKGTPMTISCVIGDQEVVALNGGPDPKFNWAISFFVRCDTQDEVDRYWSQLTADGGKEIQCGWLTDRYGLSWQIVPKSMLAMLRGDPSRAAKAMQAMFGMTKLDIAALEHAYNG